jgi:isopentenyl phosphate kinase
MLLLAGCAATAGPADNNGARDAKQIAKIDDALKGLTPGTPQSCIDQSLVRDVKKFQNTILYQYSRREIYRNNTSDGCSGLQYGDVIVSRTMTGQLCSGDIIHTVASGGPGLTGTCALGPFIPYRR